MLHETHLTAEKYIAGPLASAPSVVEFPQDAVRWWLSSFAFTIRMFFLAFEMFLTAHSLKGTRQPRISCYISLFCICYISLVALEYAHITMSIEAIKRQYLYLMMPSFAVRQTTWKNTDHNEINVSVGPAFKRFVCLDQRVRALHLSWHCLDASDRSSAGQREWLLTN